MMVQNLSEQQQRILDLTDRSYLVESDVKSKIHNQIQTLTTESLNNISRILEKGNTKEKEFLMAHIQKHPDFPSKISHFITNQLRVKRTDSEAQDRAHDDAELLDLENQIKTL